jgi:hypothetical protein
MSNKQRRTRDCRRQGSIAHDHGRAEDGDGEERDLGHVVGLDPLLDPLRPPHARVRHLDAVVGHGRVLVLLVRDHPDLGVPRYQGVQRERSSCNIIASVDRHTTLIDRSTR